MKSAAVIKTFAIGAEHRLVGANATSRQRSAP
jgi:hypothetical protein